MDKSVQIFAPATVSNVGPGFDIMGFSLEEPGDVLILKLNSLKRIRIYNNSGSYLPTEVEKNVASVALISMLRTLKTEQGFDLFFERKINPGSGVGSSAASCTAAVYGANVLLGSPFSSYELINFALEGEKLASGSLHADNIAPAMLGGIVFIRSYNPLDIIRLPIPKDIRCAVIHPRIEIKTSESRNLLPDKITLKSAVTQCGNIAGLITGIIISDYELIYRSLTDEFAEPFRAKRIPGYERIKELLGDDPECGCNISGSGPSVFALTHTREKMDDVIEIMKSVYSDLKIDFNIYQSGISETGTRIIN